MRTLHFQKDTNGRWFVHLPEWEGDKADLEMVMGADTMLDIIAEGDDTVNITVSTEPFTNYLYCLTFKEEMADGGLYELEGNNLNFEVWLCHVTKFVFGELPDKIYLR